MMRTFTVEARIVGRASLTVRAKTLEEAEKKAFAFDFEEPDVVEWEYDEIRSVTEEK